MLDDPFFWAHRVLNWLVLLTLLLAIITAWLGYKRSWGREDNTRKVYLLAMFTLDAEIIVGMALFVQRVIEDDTYFFLRPLGMLVAVSFYHIGYIRFRRNSNYHHHKTMLVTGLTTLALVLSFIPWENVFD